MAYKILIVDDSAFFRQQIKSIINAHPKLEVIGEASHGREAVDKAIKLKPHVITMDYEMPMMNGVAAVAEIMDKSPTAILMFSSLTHAGARVTLDALEAGALDYLPKGYENVAHSNSKLRVQLIEKILAAAQSHPKKAVPVEPEPAPAKATPPTAPARKSKATGIQKPSIVLLGTSTGGPVALQKVLTQIPANYGAPILMIQHMPAAFTGAFAERLNKQCKISVREAKDGDTFGPGEALLAPGGKQMMLSAKNKVKILDGDERLNYKPCVDITFGSAAKYFRKNLLAVVLTGMGSDGRDGARMLKEQGNTVWAQDSKTCVIDGMPSAVIKAELADDVVPLNELAGRLKDLF